MIGTEVKEVGTVLLPYGKGVCGKIHPIELDVLFEYSNYENGVDVRPISLTATYLSGKVEDWSYLFFDEEDDNQDRVDIIMAILDNRGMWGVREAWW